MGNSAGAAIALELVLRRPELVRAAILHEPFVPSLLGRQAEEIGARLRAMVEEALAAGGPRQAMETLIRPGIGDDDWARLDPELRERLLANAETLFGVDFEALPLYRPDEEALAAVRTPLAVVFQEGTVFPFVGAIASRLAELTGATAVRLPGSHAPFLVEPDDALVELVARRARP